MDKIRSIYRETDWTKLGIVAYYGYFAINILMKAFAYDHGDDIYKFFFAFGMLFLGIKLITTRYELREIIWAAILVGIGLWLSIVTKQNTWLLLFVTIIGIKNCKFEQLIKIALYIRVFCALVLVIGSTFGVYDIGFKTTPDTNYVELPVYSFGLNEPNYAFLTIFLMLMLLLYYNYEKLNIWWFLGTSAVAYLFYELTFCRTGIAVFFFCWGLIVFEKIIRSHRLKIILALSVAVGTAFSYITMHYYNGSNAVMGLLNHYVSGRIYIMNSYYNDQGLAWIPRNQEFFYANYYGLIDNTYMYVLLYCGRLVAMLFFVLMCWTMLRLYRQRHYRELVMISTLALYGVLEQFVMNGFMNPFILLGGILLYPGLMDRTCEKDEKTAIPAVQNEVNNEAVPNITGS